MINFEKITNDKQIKTFAKIADTIWHEYFVFLLSNDQINYMLEKFQSYEALKSQIACGYEYYFLKKCGQIIGYTGFCIKTDEFFLSKLYILKKFRNCGIGRKVLEFIIDKARENECLKITLTVNKYNESTIKAYEKWGFERIDSVVTDIGSGYVMDDYIMALNVN